MFIHCVFLSTCGEILLIYTFVRLSPWPSEQRGHRADSDGAVCAAAVGRLSQCCPRLTWAFIAGVREAMGGCSLLGLCKVSEMLS